MLSGRLKPVIIWLSALDIVALPILRDLPESQRLGNACTEVRLTG